MKATILLFLIFFSYIQATLASAQPNLDFMAAKLAVDQEIDPFIDRKWVEQEINRLVKATIDMAGLNAGAPRKLDALRTVLYVAGPWNDNRPFDYDHDEANFKAVKTTLLSNYLKTRLGNCVSMPILFLILADRLGLNVELTRSPHHLLIRYTRPDGQGFFLEPTSGGHAQRSAWIRYLMPMTDEALANGVYLSDLTREQSIAEMKHTLMEWLAQEGHYADIIPIADELIEVDPRNALAFAWRGIAYRDMIQAEFENRYISPEVYPRGLQSRYAFLEEQRDANMTAARALGWRSDSELPLNLDGWKLSNEEILRRCPKC